MSLYQKIRLRSAHQRVALTCESGFQILPKVLEQICEDQVGTVKTCALVEDTESYAKTTANRLEKLDMKDEHKVLVLNALIMFLIRVFGRNDLTDFYDFWHP